MIESTLYRCEICGATYTSRNDCAACEVFHAKLPTNNVIESAQYLPKNTARLPFPSRIVIRFTDGRRACYDFGGDMTPSGRQ